MKRYLIFVLLTIFQINGNSYGGLLEYFHNTRVNYDFLGAIEHKGKIYIYGTAGIILEFNSQMELIDYITIDDKYNIKDLVSDEEYCYGIFHKEKVLKYNHLTKKYTIQKITDDYLFKILKYNNNLICMSEKEFIILDKNLEILKKIDIPKFAEREDFVIYDDNLIFVLDSSHLELKGINSSNHQIYDLHELIDDNIKSIPDELLIMNDTLFFQIKNGIYYLYNDHINMYSKTLQNGLLCQINNEIYQLFNVNFDAYNLDSLYFYKIIKSGYQKINNSFNDRYITNLKFNDLCFLKNDLNFQYIIAVGDNNLIYVSEDFGANWSLISHLDLESTGRIRRFSKYKALRVSEGVKFTKSFENGILWKPQKNYNSYFYSEIRFKDFNANPGFVVSEYKKNEYFVYYDTKIQKDTNIAYTEGEFVKLKNVNNLIGKSIHNYKKYIFNTSSGDFFSYPANFYDFYLNYFFKFDENLNFQKITIFDSAWVVNLFDFKGNLIAVADDFKDFFNDYKTKYLSFYISTNNGKTWKKEVSLDFLSNYIAIFTSNFIDEYLFLILEKENFEFELGYVDLNNFEFNKILTLLKNSVPSQNGILKIKDTFFYIIAELKAGKILTKNFVNNKNFKDSSNWVEDEYDGRFNILNIYQDNDSLFTIYCFDSLLNKQVIFFSEPLNKINVTEHTIEVKSYLYISRPYPIPARGKTNFTIYYNKNLKFDDIEIKIYDVLGNLIAADQDVTIVSRTSYSSILTWYCNGYAPGVYLISVSLNGDTKVQPIVIGR